MVRVSRAKAFWSRMRVFQLGEILAGAFLDEGPPQIDRLAQRVPAAPRRSASRAPSSPAHRPAALRPGSRALARPAAISRCSSLAVRLCAHALHRQGADGFDARLFGGFEDRGAVRRRRAEPGVDLVVVIGPAQGIGVAGAAHQRPLRAAADCAVGAGRRAFRPLSAGGSEEKFTSSSGSPASERTAVATARLKGSEGFQACVHLSWPLATHGCPHSADAHATSTFAALSGNSSPKAR